MKNKNTKNIDLRHIEGLILRSPLLKGEKKNKLLDSLIDKTAKELQKIQEILIQSEKELFTALEKSGVDMDKYQACLKHFFNLKTKKLEKMDSTNEMTDIERQLKDL